MQIKMENKTHFIITMEIRWNENENKDKIYQMMEKKTLII